MYVRTQETQKKKIYFDFRIRAKFENMRDTSHAEPRERIKVNRFVVSVFDIHRLMVTASSR